jgi:diguanylate cyclase (GGDEF)-like protein
VSFRKRLALFFVLIVIVPMLAVTFLLFRLIGESENGRVNASIAARHDVARELLREQRRLAQVAIEAEISTDRVFVSSLQSGDRRRAAKRARQLVEFQNIERIVLVRGGRPVLQAGDANAIAPAVRPVQSPTQRFGRLEVSVIDARTYARRVRALTGLETVVRDGRRVLASTLPALGGRELPVDGDEVAVGDLEYRVVSFSDPVSFTGQRVRVSTLASVAGTSSAIREGRLTAAAILAGFFLVAIACAVLVSRTLQQQIAGFLTAAHRLGSGDFSAKVPTVGRDEFAALGEEFNKMSGELERRLAELTQQRARFQEAMLRLGEAVASNLDRDALLRIIVQTAVEGTGADVGRARVRAPDGASLQELARVGDMGGLEAAVAAVEDDALRDARPFEGSAGPAHAIAHPLCAADGGEVAGVLSIGRAGRPFSAGDRDLFTYLAGQATRSIENVQLHEMVARESVTDHRTGLPNDRAFADALANEIERSKRYDSPVGLVFLDVDDFGLFNKRYGTEQGNEVLREIARVLRENSREVDHPGRYGGEEFAIAVPGTDLDGTYNFAERIRKGIEELRIKRVDAPGTLTVTASVGVAAVPPEAADADALVAAADTAMREAKKLGKNKTVRAR